MEERIRVGVIFGGRSVEHEVSLVSARSIISNLDAKRYLVVPIGITRKGRWVTASDGAALLETGLESSVARGCFLPADPEIGGIVTSAPSEASGRTPLDVVFPIVHGGQGEDGTLQGLLDLADLPYVGAGVLASSMGMDKDVMKRIFREAGLPVVPSRTLLRPGWEARREAVLAELPGDLGFPIFVKPANTGSSVGITKAKSPRDLEEALDRAFLFDRKAVIEKAVDAREIECSVLGNDEPEASVVGEIVPCNEFYDYEAKYLAEGSKLLIPAPLPSTTTDEVRRLAVAAFKALDVTGMGRVDFFVTRDGGSVYLNEVNTLPGFTPISMYPKLWEASGL
ncbi:MAG TPA: D-alanine--D-alanine ligase family protein, partial [Candidatus Polarisedimenticolia bacterium]|nr:D-alanine--D-alanine ligase family protein [Candidatus Polarisedimenticolia bacterium]